jgi:hypothetical protein
MKIQVITMRNKKENMINAEKMITPNHVVISMNLIDDTRLIRNTTEHATAINAIKIDLTVYVITINVAPRNDMDKVCKLDMQI